MSHNAHSVNDVPDAVRHVSEAHRNGLWIASSGGPSHRVDGPTQSDGGGAAESISIAWAGAVPGARDQPRMHPTAGDRPVGPHLPAVM